MVRFSELFESGETLWMENEREVIPAQGKECAVGGVPEERLGERKVRVPRARLDVHLTAHPQLNRRRVAEDRDVSKSPGSGERQPEVVLGKIRNIPASFSDCHDRIGGNRDPVVAIAEHEIRTSHLTPHPRLRRDEQPR